MNLRASGRNRNSSAAVTSAGDAAMVLRLRRRFVVTSMAALLIILACLISFINFMNLRQIGSRADGVLQMLADGGGTFLPPSGRPGDGMPAPEAAPGNSNAGMPAAPGNTNAGDPSSEAASGNSNSNTPLRNEPPAAMPMPGHPSMKLHRAAPMPTLRFTTNRRQECPPSWRGRLRCGATRRCHSRPDISPSKR